MGLGYSEVSSSGKVLPTPLATSTEGGMNTQLTADAMKGGKKKSIKKKVFKGTKKVTKNKVSKKCKTCKKWFFF